MLSTKGRNRIHLHALLLGVYTMINFICCDSPKKEYIEVYSQDKDISFRFNGGSKSKNDYPPTIHVEYQFGDSIFIKEAWVCQRDSIYQLTPLDIRDFKPYHRVTLDAFGFFYERIESNKMAYEMAYCQAMNDSIPILCFIKQDTTVLFKITQYYKMPVRKHKNEKYASVINSPVPALILYSENSFLPQVKKYLVDNNIRIDNEKQELMSEILSSMHSGEYQLYKNVETTPIYKNIGDFSMKIKTNIDSDYYYLIASQDKSGIDGFIKQEIVNDFKKGKQEEGIEKTMTLNLANGASLGSGSFYLFIVGLNQDWTYEYLPVGSIVQDSSPPMIFDMPFFNSPLLDPKINSEFDFQGFRIENSIYSDPYTSKITSITWGDFEGYISRGFKVPFRVEGTFGDLAFVEIGSKRIPINYSFDDKKGGVYFRFEHHFPKLNIGDNYIEISFIDERGNKSSTTVNIALERVKNDNLIENNIYNNIYR